MAPATRSEDGGKQGSSSPPPPPLDHATRLEFLKVRLGFWQAIWGTILTSGVAVAIPALVEVWRISAETGLKREEARVAAVAAQTSYVTQLLNNALNQDIELRLRFANYLGHVSAPDYVEQWKGYANDLTETRNRIRSEIIAQEKELFALEAEDAPTVDEQLRMASLRRNLDWAYAEFGYAAQDTNITIPQATVSSTSTSTAFVDLAPEYESRFAAMTLRPDRVEELGGSVDTMLANRSRYDEVAAATSIPWYFVAILHQLEASGNFSFQLGTGAPVAEQTGTPASGETPPLTWEQGAISALTDAGLANLTDWSIAQILFRAEKFNGFGYRRRSVLSPYVWGCTDQYFGGRFMADGKLDTAAVSLQCGAAAYLKLVLDRPGAVPASAS